MTHSRMAVTVFTVALLGMGASEASAAYSAKVVGETLQVSGDAASDSLVLQLDVANPDVLVLEVDGNRELRFDRTAFTAVEVDAGDGRDRIAVSRIGGLFLDERLSLDGGAGDDLVAGGDGNDRLLGGAGDDLLDGNLGADVASLGAGDDVFTWNIGDGSDSVTGDGGRDELAFNGSDAPERFTVTADGSRARLTRSLGNFTLNLDSLEEARVRTFGGADTASVGDLTGTDLELVEFDAGGADALVVDGTPGPDHVTAGSPRPGTLRLSGLPAVVELSNSDEASRVDVNALGGADSLTTGVGVSGAGTLGFDGGGEVDSARVSGSPLDDGLALVALNGPVTAIAGSSPRLEALAVEDVRLDGLGGNDFVRAVTNAATRPQVTLDGGDGEDRVNGGNGVETLLGGAGDDLVDGGGAADRVALGSGDDVFASDPGDEGDSVDGGAGEDGLEVNGSAAADTVRVLRKGTRPVLAFDAGSTDFTAVERVAIRAGGGADTLGVGDLTLAGIQQVDADLGGQDGSADRVLVEGTPRRERIAVTRDGKDGVLVGGLPARTRVTGSEAAVDTLRIDPLGGDPVFVAPDVAELIRTLIGPA